MLAAMIRTGEHLPPYPANLEWSDQRASTEPWYRYSYALEGLKLQKRVDSRFLVQTILSEIGTELEEALRSRPKPSSGRPVSPGSASDAMDLGTGGNPSPVYSS